jgi:glycine dehydrogenase
MSLERAQHEHLAFNSEFVARHIGPSSADIQTMLTTLGFSTMDEFIQKVIPQSIRSTEHLSLGHAGDEADVLDLLREIAKQNQVLKSYIGMGYYNTHTPNVILRNLLENPAWYTAYTPYQPEISQGRLEAMLNFQTMVSDLTGMDIANASLLDEATAAAEAMTFCERIAKNKSKVFFVSKDCFPQTIAVLKTRAQPIGIDIVVGDHQTDLTDLDCFGVLLQYPALSGEIYSYAKTVQGLHSKGAMVVMAADLLALSLLTPPGELGADVAIGTSQRFGVPLGFGGPHAAYFATKDEHKRQMPGRMVGVSIDSHGNPAYRLALQTREQHIRREKATSNICTAQVLLANMASMFAVYHGPDGIKRIAYRVHHLTSVLVAGLRELGHDVCNERFFDTIEVETGARTKVIHSVARGLGFNLRQIDDQKIGVSLDETCNASDVEAIWAAFAASEQKLPDFNAIASRFKGSASPCILAELERKSPFLTHPVFHRHRSETQMLRYLRSLADKDLALDRSMIPLGSCTMKLNATVEMIPVTWPELSNIHPFAPADQTQGYARLTTELEQMLVACTGYDAVSLQPNAGAQGEYAGLLAIRAYHTSRGEGQRNICLIPSSAHGTNPATAHMAGMHVVVVQCDEHGNVDVQDLKQKAQHHRTHLAALMITYPSTHGIFEAAIKEICDIVHDHGGQVYIDGANMNAMVGLCQPGKFGGDVSHLNLHKTFCIPHGGGGPGVGPIGVKSHLIPYLPGHFMLEKKSDAVAAAPWGSASILPISWTYIKLMGQEGLKQASQIAILNANYIAKRLSTHYPILYAGEGGIVAHECIVDLRPIKDETGVTVDDVAKRLMDYGFHAPTMSFPVPGTLMIEPTESEDRYEIDRFCDAMIAIRAEIADIARGTMKVEESPLRHAPHTAHALAADWKHQYSREQAAFPVAHLKSGSKYWPPVGRVDNVYGDRNVMCSCPPLSEQVEEA